MTRFDRAVDLAYYKLVCQGRQDEADNLALAVEHLTPKAKAQMERMSENNAVGSIASALMGGMIS